MKYLRNMLVICLMLGALVQTGRAHELQPTIADLRQEGDQILLSFRLNAEALLSGINLDGLADTNDAADDGAYDDLRALPDGALSARVPTLIGPWNALPILTADGAPLALTLSSISVEAQPNVELPRFTRLEVVGRVPSGALAVQVTWPQGAGALVLRQQGVEAPYTGYLDLGATSPPIPLVGGGAASGWESFLIYIPVGFDHILPQGLDHILFVLGLFLLSTRWRPLLWQVTAFTLAHTVTLGMSTLGWVSVPAMIVEPLIAASIVFVAVENIFARGLSRWRTMVVFGFGLLHGLGFATVLQEFGLPHGQAVPALIGFNVGVEIGQLAVIVLAMLWVWMSSQAYIAAKQVEHDVAYRAMFKPLSVSGSLAIGLTGAYWVVERVLSVF